MNVTFATTVHGTVHAFGTAPAEEASTLRRSISAKARKFGKRLRLVVTPDGNGNVSIRAAYAATK